MAEMAILSIDAFAEKCNMPRRALMVYVKRRNVVVDGETVDTTADANVNFYNKREAKGLLTKTEKTKTPATEPKAGTKPKKKAAVIVGGVQQEPEEPEQDPLAPLKPGELFTLTNAEKRKKHFEALASERKLTLQEIEIQKKTGEVIPTDGVITLFKEVLRTFAFAYRELFEREVQKVAAIAGLDAKEIADMRSAGTIGINEAYNKALRTCRDAVKTMVKESSHVETAADE